MAAIDRPNCSTCRSVSAAEAGLALVAGDGRAAAGGQGQAGFGGEGLRHALENPALIEMEAFA